MSSITFTEYFKLENKKYEFYDIKIYKDNLLFIDPTMIANDSTDRGKRCCQMVRDHFAAVLKELDKGANGIQGAAYFLQLRENNDYHLGYSRNQSCGNSIGEKIARKIAENLDDSYAKQSKLIEDIEDSSIFVRNVSYDRISDLISQIISEEMIDYTEEVCVSLGLEDHLITMESEVYDKEIKQMVVKEKRRLVVQNCDDSNKKNTIILVPRIYLKRHFLYSQRSYLDFGIIPHYMSVENILKKKTAREDMKDKFGKLGASFITEYTIKHPEIKVNFKRAMGEKAREQIYASKQSVTKGIENEK